MESLDTDNSPDLLTTSAVDLSAQLIQLAEKRRSRRDNRNRKRFARMVKHPSATRLTMILTDRVIRIRNDRKAANSLDVVANYASVSGVGLIDFVSIKLAKVVGKLVPKIVMPVVRWRVRKAAVGIILPAERPNLLHHLKRRQKSNAKLNINVLGEAILGESEAELRCNSILEMIQRPEINYVSVKISAIVSQINAVDHAGSVSRVASRLREIYRKAQACETFINLDMEEFKDLRITVDVFKQLLDEPEFEKLSAGIVLQAYLPDSHAELENLINWGKERHARSGGSIKIRIVKGANLAQEHTDSEIHGWNYAPYASKAEVDASYLRMLDVLMHSENSQAIRIGVASHNLFHLAWAITVAKHRDVTSQIDIEMLEGMANGESLAITEVFGNVLLYSPVTYRQDFPSAVAYLVRRLDENTSPENYLSASFTMSTTGPEFEEQRDKFLVAVAHRHQVDIESKRHKNTSDATGLEFSNVADSDPTDPNFQLAVAQALNNILRQSDFHIPLGIHELPDDQTDKESGIDPSDNGRVWYSYSVASAHQINNAVATANLASETWSALMPAMRAQILREAARAIQSRRTGLIALMARDAGKPIMEADAEVSEAVDFASYYADQSLKLTTDSSSQGTVLVVPPWNFPFAIPLGGVCAALASGNSVILKPAPETVATAFAISEILWQSGVPRDVLQFVPTRDDEVGKHLVTHPGIATVILTGAFETALMFKSWKSQLNLLAETSGKNSILITASADIDTAVKDLVNSAFGHAGQKCSAASLAIVDASIYDSDIFRSQLRDAAQTLNFGPSTEIGTTNGPLIRPPSGALLRAIAQLEPGEQWLLKPKQLDQEGYLWSAGIKLGVRAGSWSHQNEWFGPILGLMRSENFNQSVEWQNTTEFGLTAGIASLDDEECSKWVTQVEAGNLYVNRGITGAIVARQPFGGWKRSSVGPTAKAGGPQYLEQLRNWSNLESSDDFIQTATAWLTYALDVAQPTSDLAAELNYLRHRPYLDGVLVRVADDLDEQQWTVLKWLQSNSELGIRISQGESVSEMLSYIKSGELPIDKVRWLSLEVPPERELLELGISVDSRPIANNVSVEMSRWLQEQSISITNHRYGNVGAGPQVTFN